MKLLQEIKSGRASFSEILKVRVYILCIWSPDFILKVCVSIQKLTLV